MHGVSAAGPGVPVAHLLDERQRLPRGLVLKVSVAGDEHAGGALLGGDRGAARAAGLRPVFGLGAWRGAGRREGMGR